eukprot:m.5065 g.5065  ORF g.5065 m.5065 type:complete len:340 (-) comp1969_c0_seq1:305-1324(-)
MDDDVVLECGKIPHEVLAPLLAGLPAEHVLIPPSIGVDACAICPPGHVSVKADPITMAKANAGKFVVAVNANDTACMGCRPKWFTSTILLPAGTTRGQLRAIWADIVADLRCFGISSAGGHTEVTPAVCWPVVAGHMIGELICPSFLDVRASRAGDAVLLWERAGIEGTAVLAGERRSDLQGHFTATELDTMEAFVRAPGICIWPFVRELLPHAGVRAIHDPTEGGVATALHEIADASGCGVRVAAAISVDPLTTRLATALGFSPLGLLASGAALVVCDAAAVSSILAQFTGRPLQVIATLTADPARIALDGQPLPRYDIDEIVRASSALVQPAAPTTC